MATFLYGIGAARSGTTWLARALRAHPQATLPPLKELHYFDTVEKGSAMWTMDQMIRARTTARDLFAEAEKPADRQRMRRRLAELDRWIGLIGTQERDDARYETLMNRQVGDAHKVVADITPAYATLNEASLGRMAALNGGDTKFLMLLRDPLDRLWSNVRLTLARRAARGIATDDIRADMVNAIGRGKNSQELSRSDYAGTLDRLNAVVPQDKVMVLFFEDLFEVETLARLSGFLGLDTPLKGDDIPVNAADETDMRPEERAALRTVLTPQYDYVAANMGAMPARWQENMQEGVS